MQNLFKYAKKELSQDAFLLWLLSNACNNDDEITRETSLTFISFLTDEKDLEIKGIKLWAQWSKIDICAEIKTKKGLIPIFIEDKTTSEEHNQLDKYSDVISRYYNDKKVYRIYKLYYKTDIIEEAERYRVETAGWKIIELEDIKSFWESYKTSTNLIIYMYANRIVEICTALSTRFLPSKIDDREIEMFAWKGFFNNYIVPEIKEFCSIIVKKTYYEYVILMIRPLGRMKENIPYMEIRDRDCLNGKLRSLILTYGMSGRRERIKDWEKIIEINKTIAESPYKQGKGNSTKQVLVTDDIAVDSSTDFLEKIKRCIDIYLKILKQLEI